MSESNVSLSSSFKLTKTQFNFAASIKSEQFAKFDENQDMQYSDNSSFGSELAPESDFERENLGFTTEEGSDQFSRAETSIESMSRLMSAQTQNQSVKDSRPSTSKINIKETNLS